MKLVTTDNFINGVASTSAGVTELGRCPTIYLKIDNGVEITIYHDEVLVIRPKEVGVTIKTEEK